MQAYNQGRKVLDLIAFFNFFTNMFGDSHNRRGWRTSVFVFCDLSLAVVSLFPKVQEGLILFKERLSSDWLSLLVNQYKIQAFKTKEEVYQFV